VGIVCLMWWFNEVYAEQLSCLIAVFAEMRVGLRDSVRRAVLGCACGLLYVGWCSGCGDSSG